MNQILVVDDDNDLLFVVDRILTKHGYHVQTLAVCEKVFDVLDSYLPNLILLDINLGLCDGRALCKQIKALGQYKDIPVVLYSSDILDESICQPCKASAFIQKPFTPENFLTVIDKLCA